MDEKMRLRLASRRDFLKKAATTSFLAGGLAALSARTALAQDKKSIKIGLVGSGGRGAGGRRDNPGAAGNCVEAGKYLGVEVKVTALADGFEDRAREPSERFGVPKENVFLGYEAYRKLIDTDVDIVLLATPPAFRPVHLEAAIKAGKHVFMEKPVAVDPPGCRKVMEMGELAKQKGLSIVAGTQRRHSRGYRETAKAVEEGAIGKIRGGAIYWCGGALWKRERTEGWSDAEYMIRNWVSFSELSGDHIVEQHVHNIDIMNWFLGTHPMSALGFGLRARRRTGNQYDFFSVDYEFPDDVHIHSMCRQIDGTESVVHEHLVGEKGVAAVGKLKSKDGRVFPEGCPEYTGSHRDYVQEHIDLLHGILKG
ncbi:MAG: Gfo/Idh/MocA family protein, partial [Anaerolineales bacterium]